MITKHFLKAIAIFAVMVILGLMGVYVVSHPKNTIFDKGISAEVAK